jgi:hypothetical protein
VVESRSPEETVQAWVDAQNLALSSGETDALRDLSAQGCNGCDNFPTAVEAVYDAGGSYQGGVWTLVNAHVQSVNENDATLTAAIRIGAGTTRPSAGADPVKYGEQNHLLKFELTQEGGSWLFSVIAFIS